MIETTSRTTYDREADALYVYLCRGEGQSVASTDEVAPGVMLDRDQEGRILGIEILDVTQSVATTFLERMVTQRAAE